MKQAEISPDLIGKALYTDLYNANGVFLLGAGKILTETDLDLLTTHRIEAVTIHSEDHHHPASAYIKQNELASIALPVMAQLDTLWRYDRKAADLYKESLAGIKMVFEETKSGRTPNVEQITRQFCPLVEHSLEQRYLFHPLHTLKGKDEYTYRHSINVGLISALIARLLQLPDDVCLRLGEAGLFHDIGKTEIPDEILHKPGALTEHEMEEMKLHPIHGHALLKKTINISQDILDCILYHHEKLDGSGYPFGLRKEEIPFYAQIVAVADCFDAMCSDRCYRGKLSPYMTAAILMQMQYNGQLNPAIVVPFVSYLAQAYIGCEVLLSNGQKGTIVLHNSQEPLRPLVQTGSTFYDLQTERSIVIEELL